MNIKNLYNKLSKYYWSPDHPSHYVIDFPDGTQKGLGLIANQNYGAFNLAWGAAQGRWQTKDDQIELVTAFSRYRLVTQHIMGQQTVGDWACMLQPADFIQQLYATPVAVPSITRDLLGVADRALRIETQT